MIKGEVLDTIVFTLMSLAIDHDRSITERIRLCSVADERKHEEEDRAIARALWYRNHFVLLFVPPRDETEKVIPKLFDSLTSYCIRDREAAVRKVLPIRADLSLLQVIPMGSQESNDCGFRTAAAFLQVLKDLGVQLERDCSRSSLVNMVLRNLEDDLRQITEKGV